jgi:thiamine pyrophosphate-dependent acetolactate synthase large subunit-like protein
VEYGANIMMVVLNDGAFGQTTMQQTSLYGHPYGTLFESPRFADIAKACGAEGIRATEPREVEEGLRQALAATKSRPALLEVMVSRAPYPKL